MKPITLAGCLLGLLSVAASADTTLEVITRHNGQVDTQVLHIAGHRLRMEGGLGAQRGVMLFDANTGTLTALNPGRSTYTEMDPQTLASMGKALAGMQSRIMAQLQSQGVELGPREQAMMDELMGQMGIGAAAAAPRVVDTGREETVNGHPCRVVHVQRGTAGTEEWCLGDPGELGIPEADYRGLRAMMSALEQMAGPAGALGGGMDGVPVRAAGLAGGGSSELVAIRHEPLPAALFQVPGDYAREALPPLP